MSGDMVCPFHLFFCCPTLHHRITGIRQTAPTCLTHPIDHRMLHWRQVHSRCRRHLSPSTRAGHVDSARCGALARSRVSSVCAWTLSVSRPRGSNTRSVSGYPDTPSVKSPISGHHPSRNGQRLPPATPKRTTPTEDPTKAHLLLDSRFFVLHLVRASQYLTQQEPLDWPPRGRIPRASGGRNTVDNGPAGLGPRQHTAYGAGRYPVRLPIWLGQRQHRPEQRPSTACSRICSMADISAERQPAVQDHIRPPGSGSRRPGHQRLRQSLGERRGTSLRHLCRCRVGPVRGALPIQAGRAKETTTRAVPCMLAPSPLFGRAPQGSKPRPPPGLYRLSSMLRAPI